MTADIAIVFALLAAATALFATEKLSVDVVALLMIGTLVVFGILSPEEALAGFASDIMLILASVFILSGALVKAGIVNWLGVTVNRLARGDKRRSLSILLTISAVASSLLSNTSTTAILTPAAMEAARRAKQSASRMLMPLAFASILGGACTLIGTSTNLAGSAMAVQLGLEPFSLFEFFKIGIIIVIAGVAWLVLFGDRLIAARAPAELTEKYEVREFLATLGAEKGAAVVDKPLGKTGLGGLGVTPLIILRGDGRLPAHPLRKLGEDDKVIVKASPEALKKVQADGRFVIDPEAHFTDKDIARDDLAMAEAVLTPQSRFVGRTLKSLAFFRTYGLVALAIHRRGQTYPTQIENMRLSAGDVLLLQGERAALQKLRGDPDLWGLVEIDETVLTRRQGLIVLGALTTALAAGGLGLLPLSIAMLFAVLIVVVTDCISMEEAYRFIEWRLLVLIAGMSAFGAAMIKTGAAAFAANYIVSASLPFGAHFALAAFAILTVLLTQPMSNAAAALTVMPVAVAAADMLGADPRTFAIVVTLSASLSFITPLEPACLLVYGPGKYKFIDFVRAGLPLTAIALTLLLLLAPVFWPLQ